MFTIFRGYKNTLCQHSNDIENHLHFYVNKVYLVYLLRKDQNYTILILLLDIVKQYVIILYGNHSVSYRQSP